MCPRHSMPGVPPTPPPSPGDLWLTMWHQALGSEQSCQKHQLLSGLRQLGLLPEAGPVFLSGIRNRLNKHQLSWCHGVGGAKLLADWGMS